MAENKQDETVELIDDEEIITLTDDEGKEVRFVEEAVVEYQGEFYALLVPVEQIDGDDDGVYIFKVSQDPDDAENDIFEFVSDESILHAVYDEYVKEVEKLMNEEGCECECGCGHHHGEECNDGCGCDHDHGDGCGCEHKHEHGHGHGHGEGCGCGKRKHE